MNVRLSRRSFLGSFAGLAALPLAASAKAASLASAPAADIIASAPPLTPMWAAGTPGEFDWQPFSANSAEEAFSKWCDHVGYTAENRPVFSSAAVQRVKAWDGRTPDQISPADWIRGGLGHGCERCQSEVMADCATVIEGEVVCHECMTYGEKLDDDEDFGIESLADLIDDMGEVEAKAYLVQHEDFDLIGEERWLKAAAEAALLAA
ncbi:hypothetical protein OIU34_22930 [Pararhizobium sp. BT-229]|uniref:hypothetical protein n=1 Tax=Pararhizobium sp. BT-229 TaxID=2986923 RepID=UPI0021F6A6E0|nr:hypothetical protein [Pararhizobium sp. BT-229]MCV9964750.1 hypothetical protein [Pararhizobium sp. BT-229]